MNDVRDEVRARYAEIARRALDRAPAGSTCCTTAERAHETGCCGEGVADARPEPRSAEESSCGVDLYGSGDREVLPDAALATSLGCGNPTAVAELEVGETVLDLGSGGGIDVLLSAARVGPTGKVYGLDMTDEMLALAQENVTRAGVANVELLKGYIEDMPLPAAVVDVIISNCVINLAADKEIVFREMHRVLKPGGRVGVSDIVASPELSPEERAQRGSYVGCIAGALSTDEYETGLRRAGFESIEIIPSHGVAEGMFSAIIRARKPARRLEPHSPATGPEPGVDATTLG
jgi:arsenite methyltransferase